MRKLVLLGACLFALLLAACGSSESDEEKITSAIETLATTSDPADCEALATLDFMEQTEFEEGDEAVKSCEEGTEDDSDDPDSVEVAKVAVNGSSATAEVTFAGGSFDGQTVAVGLVEEDGDWKLDEIERFVVFDREQLLSAFRESFEEEQGAEGEGDAVATCVLDELEASSDAEVQEAVLSPDAFLALVEDCV